MSSPYGTGPKGKATELHAKITRAKGRCENCGATNVRLECSHIIGRRYAQTRTDLDNAHCLCHQCHQWFGDHPPEFRDFIYSTIGEEKYAELNARSLQTTKIDWVERVAILKAIWNDVEVSA